MSLGSQMQSMAEQDNPEEVKQAQPEEVKQEEAKWYRGGAGAASSS